MQDLIAPEHSILAPSSASRWIRCAGSVPMERGKRDTSGTAAREGTALHEVAFQSLEKNITHQPGDIVEDVVITQDGLDAVGNYIQYVNSVRGDKIFNQLEKRVDCSVIHPECFGTPDYWEFFQIDNLLEIADYKNGRTPVSAVENWQMLTYLSGIVAGLRITLPFVNFNDTLITVTIVQPNSNDGGDTIKQWKLTGADLKVYTDRLRNAAHQAMSSDPVCTPSPESCKYCKGRLVCDSFNSTADNLIVCVASSNVPSERNLGYTMQQIWLAEKMIKALKSAVESEIFEEIKQGRNVVGCETGTGRGRLSWSGTIEETVPAAQLLGVDIMKTPERITPTQAKTKLKKAGLPEDLFKSLTAYNPGKLIIKPVDLSKTKLAFGNKEN